MGGPWRTSAQKNARPVPSVTAPPTRLWDNTEVRPAVGCCEEHSHEDDHIRRCCPAGHRRGGRRGPGLRCQELLRAGRSQSQLSGFPRAWRARRRKCHPQASGEIAMKMMISALLALSVLSGYAASAMADKVPPSIWEQLDRDGRGGHPT